MKETITNYVYFWEFNCYKNGIPQEVPNRIEHLNKAPSYKAIVKAIMKNDISLKSLGYTQKKCKAYNQLKRIELSERNVITQMELL